MKPNDELADIRYAATFAMLIVIVIALLVSCANANGWG
jgi:hypothetical protein